MATRLILTVVAAHAWGVQTECSVKSTRIAVDLTAILVIAKYLRQTVLANVLCYLHIANQLMARLQMKRIATVEETVHSAPTVTNASTIQIVSVASAAILFVLRQHAATLS
jgi:hypothetical protein